MKKFTIFMAAVALVCFSVPAMAVDWNFYGNARMATFYQSRDFGDQETPGSNGQSSKDQNLDWDFQGNSRIGANVKAENISGHFEFGVGDDELGGGNVSSRRLYGVWNFGSGTLKVGKDYTPVSQFISGQVFDGDLGLLGIGAQYGARRGQIAFGFGGFEIALVTPENLNIADDDDSNGDVDDILPKIEASWGMSFDAWNFGLLGGFQYYSIEDVLSEVPLAGTDDLDVTSWVLGGDVGFNFGPGYVKAAASYGQNIGNANWGVPEGLNTRPGTYQGGLAVWDGDDDTNDTNTFMGAVVGGLKVSDMLSFEGGFGYRKDQTDGGLERDTAPWVAYVQSVIALAPGVYIIPEVGYYDLDNNATSGSDREIGSLFYIGGKWQINF